MSPGGVLGDHAGPGGAVFLFHGLGPLLNARLLHIGQG
jgi:hypothetical protein